MRDLPAKRHWRIRCDAELSATQSKFDAKIGTLFNGSARTVF